jgi:hypothetical protein
MGSNETGTTGDEDALALRGRDKFYGREARKSSI